jgi:hypothetical protein
MDRHASLFVDYVFGLLEKEGRFLQRSGEVGLCLIRDEMRVDVLVWAQLMRVGEHVYVDL